MVDYCHRHSNFIDLVRPVSSRVRGCATLLLTVARRNSTTPVTCRLHFTWTQIWLVCAQTTDTVCKLCCDCGGKLAHRRATQHVHSLLASQ